MSKKTWDELDPLGLERSHAEAEDRLHKGYDELDDLDDDMNERIFEGQKQSE